MSHVTGAKNTTGRALNKNLVEISILDGQRCAMQLHEKQLKEIGQRLRAVRKARGLPMRIAATIRERYGVKLDQSYLSRMERGESEVPLRTLFALADFFEVDPCDLLRPNAHRTSSELILKTPVIQKQLDLLMEYLPERQLVRIIESCLNAIWQALRAGEEQRGESAAVPDDSADCATEPTRQTNERVIRRRTLKY
ncbi:MAG: helix-turn-helix transcriptional regulator [Leptospiraceae bacterium]|nr:helix-turn-helix transcriptional regulator [Leptospiraceae bacterium]MCB1321022.1 helix-turn-helix transcriptional regulator [Leptospiraceae bacterium]